MMLPLDFKTQTRALQVARRLATMGEGLEGLSLLRELIAGLVNSNQILAVIEAWIASRPRSLLPSSDMTVFSRRLPGIIETFAASGYATEAARVMATGVGLDPAISRSLVEAGRGAFGSTKPKIVTEASNAAALELAGVGMSILKAGNPEGITLLGAAQSVSPQFDMPVADIAANLENLQIRRPVFLELEQAQTVTKAAYDLHFSGRQEPALRVGTLVSAMTSGPSANQLIGRLARVAKPDAGMAFRTSRQILEKGYAAEAVNLLVDSGSVSAEDMWVGLNEEISGPSNDLKPPGATQFALRSVWSKVARPAKIDPPGPSFFFELQGKDTARCNEALWGKAFDLVFRYDLLPADAAAGLLGRKITQAVSDEIDLGIVVIPKGLVLTGELKQLVAKFKGGKMIGEVPRFGLKAPEKSADVGRAPYGLHIVFTVAGSMIYSFFLEIRLVEVLSTAPCDPLIIDLDFEEDVAAKVKEPRVVNLYTLSKGDVWEIYGTINGVTIPSDVTKQITGARLQKVFNGGTVQEFTDIADETIWKNIDENLDGPADDKENALASMKAAVAAGSALYQLFLADDVFRNVMEKIEKLPDRSRITIFTDDTVFPWELFYPLEYVDDSSKPANYQPEKFWGHRFIIETLLVTTKEEDKPPARRQQPGKLHVSMGYNNSIDHEEQWAGRELLPVQLQKDFFDASLTGRGAYFDQYDEIHETLSQPYSASMIYFFCHGAADELKFDDSRSIFKPRHVTGESYPGWPIIFLNACDAADISPLSFFSFRRRFHAKKAAGLIAPSFPIPTLFAAVFGRAFLGRYVDQQPIGKVLFDLRRELVAKNNPLGLWYSLQCPLDVSAPEK